MAILESLFQRDRDLIGKADQHYQKGELHKAAELYLKAKSYEQAADVFAKLGQLDEAVDILRQSGRTLKAAELLDAYGEYKGPNGAIVLYEEAGEHRKAAEACLRMQMFVRAGRNFEQAEIFRRAAESYSRAGEMERALQAWKKEIAELRRRRETKRELSLDGEIRELELLCAEILESLGRGGEAAQLLRQHGLAERAAALFTEAGMWAEAAEAYLTINRPKEAFEAIEKAENPAPELRAEIYLRCAKHAEAASLFENLGRHEEAAEAFEKIEAWAQAAAEWEKAESPERAALLYARVGRHLDAAHCFAQADQHQAAARAFAKAGEHEAAANAWEAAKRPFEAAEAYLTAGLEDAALKTLQGIEPDRADYSKASALLIPLLLDRALLEGARHRFQGLEDTSQIEHLPAVDRLYLKGRFQEAEANYQAAEVSYQKVLAEHHGYRDAEERLRDVRLKLQAPESSGAMPIIGFDGAMLGLPPLPPEEPPPVVPEESGSVPAVSAPLAGPTLDGLPFELREPLEPWWVGTYLHRAVDRRDDKSVFLVSFPEALAGSQDLGATMGKIVSFQDPAVLRLHEVIRAHGNVLLLHEPFDGQPLQLHLAHGTQPPHVGLNILLQLCSVLTNAHKLNIIHRWLSPRTVLVADDLRVKIVGLGLRELASRDHTGRAYLAPEVLRGEDPSPASDVYSVGLLAVALLRAQLPVSWNPKENLDSSQVKWPSEVEEGVSSHVRAILIRCLRTDPVGRPTVEELRNAITSMGLLPGQILMERYEILGELGRGGMSRVYHARDRQFDEEVAIKTVITPAAGPTEDQDRLFREVQLCRKISHPNVVRVHDFGQFPGGIFIIMELLEGPGLDQVIRERKKLPLDEVKKVLREITAALGEAHRVKAIHRDLKPANVMRSGDRYKVMDFGIALITDDSAKQLTRAGEVMGSPLFMAPEQIQGLPLTEACDFYALGVIAYTMLAGREPFQAETATAVVLKHLNEPPPDIHEFRPGLPADWVTLLGRLLAKDPKERLRTAIDVTAAIEKLPV